jgi:hypothetical protein
MAVTTPDASVIAVTSPNGMNHTALMPPMDSLQSKTYPCVNAHAIL